MSFTPPNVASPHKPSELHEAKMIDESRNESFTGSTSYSDDSYSDSEESFKVIEIKRDSANVFSNSEQLVQDSAKHEIAKSQSEPNARAHSFQIGKMPVEENRETELEQNEKSKRESVKNEKESITKLIPKTNMNKKHQKERADNGVLISTDNRLPQSTLQSSSYSPYSYSSTTYSLSSSSSSSSLSSHTSPHVETKVPSHGSLSNDYTQEYTETLSSMVENENKKKINDDTNFNNRKKFNAVHNYPIVNGDESKKESNANASFSSYSTLSVSNSTITQKEKRSLNKESRELDINKTKKENVLEKSNSALLPSSSSYSTVLSSYYTSVESFEQKADKLNVPTSAPPVPTEIPLNTSKPSRSSSSSSYEYSSSSSSSSSSGTEKHKKMPYSQMQLHHSLQQLPSVSSKATSTLTKSVSSISSEPLSSSFSSETSEEQELQEHKEVENADENRELIVVRVEQIQQPLTPPLPKRCFVHPLLWHSAEGVYNSKLEDATSTFLEQLLEMQYKYESHKMGGRSHETAELSSLEVVHGKPFTSSARHTLTSKLFRLISPSSLTSSQSKKKQPIRSRENVTTSRSNNASSTEQSESWFVSERFEHDGRVSLLEPTPPSHFSKRSINIALSVLDLTRSEKDKLIMEARPPVPMYDFNRLFDACVNTRMKEHVAHIFLSHDAERKGELPFDETAELLQRCGVAASPWIANVKIDIAASLQSEHSEISNKHLSPNDNEENDKVNFSPQLVLVSIKKNVPGSSNSVFVSNNSVGSAQSSFNRTTTTSGRHNAVDKNSKNRKEQAATMLLNELELANYERREIRVCDIVNANMLAGCRTSVYWRDNSVYISDTLICTDIKREEDYERIKTYVEAATYICILVKMFTIIDLYNKCRATVEYPHVVRTLLLAEMTSTSLQRKLRKLHRKSLMNNLSKMADKKTLVHAPRNLYIQNVFRNCFLATTQISKITQLKGESRNFRLIDFLESRLVESSLQETSNSQAKRSRNALPSARVDNLAFYEPSKKVYNPLSVVCSNAQVQLPAAENIYFKFALINVRVPLFTPESYQCYCLVSAMTNDGVFLPAVKISVKKVAKSQTFANSETWMFDKVEDENAENVIYYRGHLEDKIFIECCYERKKEKYSADNNYNKSTNGNKGKSTESVGVNTTSLSVLNTTNFVDDKVENWTDKFSSVTSWSKNTDLLPESIIDKALLSDEKVWSAGYAVLSLSRLQFSKKGICRKRLDVVADSISNYEMTKSNINTLPSTTLVNEPFRSNASSLTFENTQTSKAVIPKPAINNFGQREEKNKKDKGNSEEKNNVSGVKTQARHVDIVIYSKPTQKCETQYEKSKTEIYDLPSRSLLLRRHVLMISEIREAIRHIGESSHHTRQALHQFNVKQLLHLVSNANLLTELIKLWKYKMEHMTSKQLESKEYKFEQLLLCAASVSAVHHSTNLPIENIAQLLIKKKRIHLSSLLSSSKSTTLITAAKLATNSNCCQRPVRI